MSEDVDRLDRQQTPDRSDDDFLIGDAPRPPELSRLLAESAVVWSGIDGVVYRDRSPRAAEQPFPSDSALTDSDTAINAPARRAVQRASVFFPGRRPKDLQVVLRDDKRKVGGGYAEQRQTRAELRRLKMRVDDVRTKGLDIAAQTIGRVKDPACPHIQIGDFDSKSFHLLAPLSLFPEIGDLKLVTGGALQADEAHQLILGAAPIDRRDDVQDPHRAIPLDTQGLRGDPFLGELFAGGLTGFFPAAP